MTILGVVMNNRSDTLLSENLVPVLKQLPQQGGAMVEKITASIHTNPQALYSALLSPETLSQFPQELIHTMVPIVKSALVDSLHAVFWFGLMFVLLGALLTPMLGKIKLVKQPRKKTRQGGFKRCCNRVTDKGYEKTPAITE